MGVGGGQKLHRFLAGRIEGDGIVHSVVHRKGQLGIAAVNRGGTGIDQMGEVFQRPAGLHHHQLAGHVGVDIGVGVDQRIAHPGLGGEMEYS